MWTGGVLEVGPRGAARDLQRATERGRRPRARQRQDLRAVRRARWYVTLALLIARVCCMYDKKK